MEIVVNQGQSLFDVAIQYCGDVSAVFDIAVLNSISITEVLAPGAKLLMPATFEPDIVKYFLDNNFIPATEIQTTGEIEVPEGIGYWAIGLDFIVS